MHRMQPLRQYLPDWSAHAQYGGRQNADSRLSRRMLVLRMLCDGVPHRRYPAATPADESGKVGGEVQLIQRASRISLIVTLWQNWHITVDKEIKMC